MNDIASIRKMRLQSGFGNTTGVGGTTELGCTVSAGSDGFLFDGKTQV
jgi:hypothetical protein